MIRNLNTENHLGTVQKLGEGQETSVVNEKFDNFMRTYQAFLWMHIARKLRRPASHPDMHDCVQGFCKEQLVKIRKGRPNVFSRWDGQRSFRGWLASCCWKSTRKQLGIPPGTPAAYEAFREDLEALVIDRLTRPGVSENLQGNADYYVREFLEYYSSRHPHPPKEPHKNRRRQTKDGVVESTWWDDFQEACWRYVEWWLVRPAFPAWDYLVCRERLMADLRASVDAAQLPDESALETLVDEFLNHYGGQNLRVRKMNGVSTNLPTPSKEMQDEFRKYVVNGQKWRAKYAAKPRLGVEAVQNERPRRRRTVLIGVDVDQLGKGSARRDDRADNGQQNLHHEPGDDRMRGGRHESHTPADRQLMNELALAVICRYQQEHKGTPHAALLRARALEPFADNMSKAPPYKEIYGRCGFRGQTEEEKLRAAELAWKTVQDQIKATLRRVLNDRWSEVPQLLPREEWVEQEVREFYNFLEDVVRHIDLAQNAHQPLAQNDLKAMLRHELNDRWTDLPGLPPRESWVEQEVALFYPIVENLVTKFDRSNNGNGPSAQDEIKATLRGKANDRWRPDTEPETPRERWVEQQVALFCPIVEKLVKDFDRSQHANDRSPQDDPRAAQCRELYDRSAQDDLRSYVRECLHPQWSKTTPEEPDLSRCSLGLIAVLLLEPGVRPIPEDRRREWEKCLRTPLRELLTGTSMEAPFDADDGAPGAADTPHQDSTPEADAWQDRSFGDLIHDRQPDIEHLKQVKCALRSRYRQAGHDVDSEILVAAYLAAIAAAFFSTGEKITRKKDSELADDLCWLAGEEWIDQKTRELAERALKRLKGMRDEG